MHVSAPKVHRFALKVHASAPYVHASAPRVHLHPGWTYLHPGSVRRISRFASTKLGICTSVRSHFWIIAAPVGQVTSAYGHLVLSATIGPRGQDWRTSTWQLADQTPAPLTLQYSVNCLVLCAIWSARCTLECTLHSKMQRAFYSTV